MMIKAGVIGATGYAGQQLVQLLKYHPNTEITFLCSNSFAGQKFSELQGNYEEIIDDVLVSVDEAVVKIDEIDVLFLALPHGKSSGLAKKAYDKGVKVVDMGADFRLDTLEEYTRWYETEHACPELLDESIYGLVELKEGIAESKIAASPGCYPTATLLGLAPVLINKLIDTKSIIVDAKSGISGAGKGLNAFKLYCEAAENVKAYKIASHRHTAEIEQELSKMAAEDVTITFTPTLVPMSRGILSTIYATLKADKTREDLLNLYKEFYKEQYFVRVKNDNVETRFVKGTNFCDVSIYLDERTNRVIITSAIDNLIKGSAGQAIQNMNLMFGLDVKTGIAQAAMYI